MKIFPSLEVHWGGPDGNRDLVVGYLEFDRKEWAFHYADDLKEASSMGFEGFRGLPKQSSPSELVKSPSLFLAFSTRIPGLQRADVIRVCGDLTGLPREEAFYEFLRRSGGRTGTDQLWFSAVSESPVRKAEGLSKALRNEIRKMVGAIRLLLMEDILLQLEGAFRILPDGQVLGAESVDPERLADRRAIESVIHYHMAAGRTSKEAVDVFTREIGFTYLNRLAALKMMEARGLIQESVSNGTESSGFRLFRRVCEEVCTSDSDGGYRRYLELMFDDVAAEVRVLFDRTLPHSRIFPRSVTLNQILNLLNTSVPAEIWKSDETIGWIYQYFTPKEDREALRDAKAGGSQVPRNSYELAVRNQFYTPRYVVEFLTDNTLGRLWYEMRKGRTQLRYSCRYLVRKPSEIFLPPREVSPKSDSTVGLSEEEPPQLGSTILHRETKDPRDIRLLDPACGSGHFLLYAFDLLAVIYEEAWVEADCLPFTETGRSLRDDYSSIEKLRRELPALILRQNLHGIDIDLRATQIAAFALWLRAQRAYFDLGLKSYERPPIRKSNIVCAEPMPGDQALLNEFVSELQPPVLRQLVRVVFEKMQLAGEAGFLLKIEGAISDALAEAHRQWAGATKAEQMLLWPEARRPKPEQPFLFDTSGITEETFWQDAEERVLDELANYSRHAENGHGVARYLFAEDATQGFAFVNLCRKRFDVALTNPPFGQPSAPSQQYIADHYEEAKYDMYSASLARCTDLLVDGGGLGAITNRTGFFLSDFTEFRERFLLGSLSMTLAADLGDGVLDGAMVSTAAYCLWRRPTDDTTTSTWYRLLDVDIPEKGNTLVSLVTDSSSDEAEVFTCRNTSFRVIRTSPLAYWVPEPLRQRIGLAPEFEPTWGIVRTGLQSLGADDQFIRAFWEVPPLELRPDRRWVAFAKGGDSHGWYHSPYLVTDWENDGQRPKRYAIEKYGTITRKITGIGLFFRPGLTYTTYTILGFRTRVLPAGCIFSLAGSGVFTDGVSLPAAAGYLNSTFVEFFLRMTTDGRKWDPGYIKHIPVPTAEVNLHQAALSAIDGARLGSESVETTREFVCPTGRAALGYDSSIRDLAEEQRTLAEARSTETARTKNEIDHAIFGAFGFSDSDIALVRKEVARFAADQISGSEDPDEETSADMTVEPQRIADDVLSYAVGCAFGRWDIRIGRDPSLAPRLSDFFDSLPVCQPGMLIDPEGLPARTGTIASEEWLLVRQSANVTSVAADPGGRTVSDEEYPIPSLPWDGVLVDDEGHPSDIVTRVRQVLRLLWPTRGEDIERELAEILGVRGLRPYFRNSRKFFEEHCKRYSKSRRKAPIYWLLQSAKKSYGVWLYYHRLTKDTLFHLVRNYIDPKIQHEEGRRHELRRLYEAAKAAKNATEERRLAKDMDIQDALVGEIIDFKVKIESAAYGRLPGVESGCPGWDPDRNDGVLLNIAPLHAVVPWKEASKSWEELANGRYDWSRVALQFWPRRGETRIHKDRSPKVSRERKET